MAGLTGELENLGGEVLEDGGGIYGGFCTYADVMLCPVFEVSVDTAYGELKHMLALCTHHLQREREDVNDSDWVGSSST